MKKFAISQRSAWIMAVVCILVFGVIDGITGYELNFFLFYFLPVIFAAWQIGLGATIITSVMSAIVWAAAEVYSGHPYTSQIFLVWNALLRFCAFLIVGWSHARIHELLQQERARSAELRRSLSEIKILEGLLSVCAGCKKIMNDQGQWQQMETYLTARSGARFSHGYCPDCARRFLTEAGLADAAPDARDNP
jgi:hypothetical protein